MPGLSHATSDYEKTHVYWKNILTAATGDISSSDSPMLIKQRRSSFCQPEPRKSARSPRIFFFGALDSGGMPSLPPPSSPNACLKSAQTRTRLHLCTDALHSMAHVHLTLQSTSQASHLISRNCTGDVEALMNTTHIQRQEFMPVCAAFLRTQEINIAR